MATVRGCPCPVAGRSLRHPAFAHSMLTALRHPACACQQRRLSGHGQPLTDGSDSYTSPERERWDHHGCSVAVRGMGSPSRTRAGSPNTEASVRRLGGERVPSPPTRSPSRRASGACLGSPPGGFHGQTSPSPHDALNFCYRIGGKAARRKQPLGSQPSDPVRTCQKR
jgi:hypothetical protein